MTSMPAGRRSSKRMMSPPFTWLKTRLDKILELLIHVSRVRTLQETYSSPARSRQGLSSGWRNPTGDRKRRGAEPQMARIRAEVRSISERNRRGVRKPEEGLVRPGMVGDEVPFVPGAAHHLLVLSCALSDHKERRLHILFTQQVQEAGSIGRAGPVIEGQGHAERGSGKRERFATSH